MSSRYQAGIVLPGYNALKVANAPTIGTATSASGTSVSVTFTAPACTGGGAISSYTVFANCGVYGATGASSPLTVTGLTAGTAYTFKAIATNVYGPSYPSAASNSVTPPIAGQQAYTTAGTYSWVAPTGVTSVSMVAVGGGKSGGAGLAGGNGEAGGGGGLGYKNNYAVTPGNSYSLVVGAAGADSYFVSTAVVKGGGGGPTTNRSAGTYTGDGGGNGGLGGLNGSAGGGGAGGYAGNGGDGGWGAGTNGPGGAGGGGVGLLGQGSNGTGGSSGYQAGSAGAGGGGGGGGGSFRDPVNGGGGGSSGSAGSNSTGTIVGAAGGLYGGAGGGGSSDGLGAGGAGTNGAVRIIWPGTTRSFPSTNTGDL